MITPIATQKDIIYPDSDGKPMADNTKQFRYIVTIQGGLDALFQNDPNVFVAGDLLWYPVEGSNTICTAPDVMVVFGRPKGDRGSYQQWREDNIPPQVVFEILSPNNTLKEMAKKLKFYEHYGVEEYYLYDPDDGDLTGWLRSESGLQVIEEMVGWVSQRLGIRFELSEGELVIYRPDGERFATYVELVQQNKLAKQQAIQERQRAEQGQAQLDRERQRAEHAEQRSRTLAERLQQLGVDPNQL